MPTEQEIRDGVKSTPKGPDLRKVHPSPKPPKIDPSKPFPGSGGGNKPKKG